MTNRDAINLLEEVKILDDTMYAYNASYLEALDMAIAALETVETAYYKGKADGIRECTARVKKLNAEIDKMPSGRGEKVNNDGFCKTGN